MFSGFAKQSLYYFGLCLSQMSDDLMFQGIALKWWLEAMCSWVVFTVGWSPWPVWRGPPPAEVWGLPWAGQILQSVWAWLPGLRAAWGRKWALSAHWADSHWGPVWCFSLTLPGAPRPKTLYPSPENKTSDFCWVWGDRGVYSLPPIY